MPHRIKLGATTLGLMLCALVLACVAGASASAQSTGAPSSETAPLIRGTAADGKKLKATNGTWSGSRPFSYGYSWELCNAEGGECATIAAASGSSYQLGSTDIGRTLRVVVTATNSEGHASASSAPSAVIGATKPKKKGSPKITGDAQDGQLLSAVNASWKGSQPMTFHYQWQLCGKSGCDAIDGATQSTYRASTADIGSKLRVVITAANSAGSTSASSKKTSAVVAGPPVSLAAPSVSGLPLVEQTLSAEPGTWAGTGPFEFKYQWRGCNLVGECEDISGATGPTYTVGPLQVANSIEVTVTAKNSLGSASATSEETNIVKALLPSNLELPSITGLLQDGGLLSALTGSWSSSEPLSFSYAWELCNAAGLECKPISGALESTLGLITSEIGSTLRVVVTATNSAGSTSATSEPTSLVKALLPSNTGLPSVTGLLQDGGLLKALTGSWSGSEPLSFSYAWELCDSAGEACHEVSEAIGSTLSLISGDIGSTVRVVVTATNGAGSTSATSEPTGLIGALLPSNTKLPSITGLLQDGSTLSGLVGSWSGSEPLSFSYAWELCNSSGGACKEISGAIGSTLGLVTSEIGSTVRLIVTASNSGGSTSATSEPTSLVKALLPSNTELPSITGLLQDGSTLSGLVGSWSGSGPLSYSYAWELCDGSGGACKEISGAVGSTLGLVTGEIGSTVRLIVTASNSGGSTSATSEPTSLVKALLPSNTELPSITGLLQDGSTLSGLVGSWSGSGPLSYSYAWELCNGSGGACKEISGAIGSTLGLVTSEIGSTVRLIVTASNSGGSTSATSEPTSLVKALLPSNTELPSITGLLQDGSSLSAVTGAWSGSGPLSYSYAWELCNGSGSACKEISGAIGSTLGLVTSEIGSTVRLIVTASNSGGSTSATSEPTSIIKALLPSNTKLPSIAGELIDTKTLSAATGAWSGSEPLSFSYAWELCNSSGSACKEISGAIGSTLGLVTSEIGSTVRLVVTATNSGGSTSATSEPTSLVKALIPSNTKLPSITGLLQEGGTLTGAVGSWTGSEPLSYSYAWELCNSSGSACKEISGAIGSTLGLVASEIGSTVRLVVTASNSGGSTAATSEATSVIKALLPSNTELPSIAGVLQTGHLLEALVGKWTGTAPISYGFQWQTCGLLGIESECKNIKEAIADTLKLELLDVGLTVRVLVTATNAAGSVTKASSISSAILGLVLTPDSGSSGTAVTLAAPDVSKATAVRFGSKKSSDIEVDSANEITAIAPAGAEGTVPVTVTTPEGSSHENSEDQFTYES